MDVTRVVKSKSSNSGKTVKSDHRNKKSRSNAELPPYVMKKRGVYVEPNRIRSSAIEKNQAQERPKAPPRPRPGNKKFLASVLTILSKSTEGTQFPDIEEPSITQRKHRSTRKLANTYVKLESMNKIRETHQSKPKKKLKYRSKALEADREIHQKQFVVLQSKKEIAQTPSIYSENESYNLSKLPSLVHRAQKNTEERNGTVEDVASELTKEILEGARSRKDRRVRIDEPNTRVVSTLPNKSDPVSDSNGKLYNFFVDLLETTISVYNVKQEYDKAPSAPSEASSTKVKLEIDECVAKKLGEPREKPKEELPEKLSNHFYCLKDLEFHNRAPDPVLYERAKSARRRKPKTESYSFNKKPAKLKAESVMETKKTSTRKQKKKTLLNLFKEQLRMDEDAFEEPQNLYQALKVIAQNKRKCQKAIHYRESSRRKKDDYGFPECMFKCRNVISPSTKYTYKEIKNQDPSLSRKTELGGNRPKSEYTTDLEESYHSLEVKGYDYEVSSVNKTNFSPRNLVFTYHSTPTSSERSFGFKDVLDFSETDSMYFM